MVRCFGYRIPLGCGLRIWLRDPCCRQTVDIVNKCEFGGYGIKSSLGGRDQNSCVALPNNFIVVQILRIIYLNT
jgi:hypothetical protein